jgi:DNA processing protein
MMLPKKGIAMTGILDKHISTLETMRKYPDPLFYRGDLSVLDRPRIAIVGTRKPSPYTRQFTYELARALSRRGVCIVSGAAMGVDAIAHQGAGVDNTIAVMANGLDIRYPAVNAPMIAGIEQSGLVLSQFPDGQRAANWGFVVRNELVVALGDILIVTEADENSGSMRSVEYALKMEKPIYVLPHPLDASRGTNRLLAEVKAKPIYEIDMFADRFGTVPASSIPRDDFFYFCQQTPTFDEAVAAFGDRVYESELMGEVRIENGRIRIN